MNDYNLLRAFGQGKKPYYCVQIASGETRYILALSIRDASKKLTGWNIREVDVCEYVRFYFEHMRDNKENLNE
jgi:hypothetical protein